MIKFVITVNTMVESFWQRQLQFARDLMISPHSSRVRLAVCCFFFELWLFSLSAMLLLTEVDRPCCTYRVTVETPSTNFVLNSTLALLNIPSFRETTMNCKRNKSILRLIYYSSHAKCTYCITGISVARNFCDIDSKRFQIIFCVFNICDYIRLQKINFKHSTYYTCKLYQNLNTFSMRFMRHAGPLTLHIKTPKWLVQCIYVKD